MQITVAEDEAYKPPTLTFGSRQAIRFWQAAHRANETAAVYGREGILTSQDIAAVLSGLDTTCYWCGKVWNPEKQRGRGPNPDTFGIDHIVALSMGGPNTPDNIVASCHACNVSKFQADRPGRWAQRFKCCVICGTTNYPHEARGRCLGCYRSEYEKAHPDRDHNYTGNGKARVNV